MKRHGCPSHGIALTPDEKELWVADGRNNRIHIFDATVMPPKQGMNIQVRDLPGLDHVQHRREDGVVVDGEVIDAKTKKIVGAAEGRCRARLPEREDARDRGRQRQGGEAGRSVRHRRKESKSGHGRGRSAHGRNQ